MKDLIIYYGMQNPNLEKSQALQDTRIVMQEYHPMVSSQMHRHYFKHSEIYLYFNCNKVSLDEYKLCLKNTKIIKIDLEWDAVVLDLADDRNLNYLTDKANQLIANNDIEGLFLDDLDFSFSAEEKKHTLALIEGIELKTEQGFILNRGFELWRGILASKNIRAIVLESFVPEHFSNDSDLNWFDAILDNHIFNLNQNFKHIDLFAINYEERKAEASFDDRITKINNKFNHYNIKFLDKKKELDQWSKLLM